MPYNPPDFYGALRVQPDHRIIYEGKKSLGDGLASGINSATAFAGDMKTMDKQQAHSEAMFDKQLAGQSAMQNDRQGFEEMMFGKREASDAERRKQEKAYQEAEVARFGDNKLSAAFSYAQGVSPGIVNDETFELFKGIKDPKVKAEMADRIIDLAANKMRQTQEQEQAIVKAQQSRQTYPLNDPLTGKPDEGYYMTGNNIALPRQTAKPKTDSLTPEQMQSMGFVPDSATVGGVKYTVPKQEAAPGKIEVELKDGRKVTMSPSEAARLGFIETPASTMSNPTTTPTSGFLKTFQ